MASQKKSLFFLLLGIVLLFTVMNVYFISKVNYVGSGDDARYATVGRNVLEGKGFVIDVINKFFYPYPRNITHPEDVYPPAYPLAVAMLFGLFGETALMAKLPALIIALLVTPLLTYAIGRRMVSEKAGFVAGLLALLSPVSFAWSGISDSMFAGFCLAAVCCLVYGFSDKKWWYGVGIFLSLAFLTKPTGLMLTLAVWGACVLVCLYTRKWPKKEFVMGFVFGLVLAVPWLVRNQLAYGNPLFSMYSAYVFMVGFFVQNLSEVTGALYWGTPIDFSWFLAHVGFGELAMKVLRDSLVTLKVLGPLLLCAVLGSFAVKKKQMLASIWFFFAVFAGLYTLLYPFSVRYYLPVLPLLFILAAAWVMNGAFWNRTDVRKKVVTFGVSAFLILLFVFSISRFFVSYSYLPPGINMDPGYPRSSQGKDIQLRMDTIHWIRENIPQGSSMFVSHRPHDIAYYDRVKTVAVPFEPLETILAVGDYYHVQYLVNVKNAQPKSRQIRALDGIRENPAFTLLYENDIEEVYWIDWSKITLEKRLMPCGEASQGPKLPACV